jgi:hypothetical protein
MLCAHTVRRLHDGTFDDFKAAFTPSVDDAPPGWVRFVMLQPRTGDPNHVVTFGFFDGTLEELEASQRDHGYEETRAGADQYVAELLVNGVYDVVVDLRPDPAAAT